MNTIPETYLTDYRMAAEDQCFVDVDPEHMQILLDSYTREQERSQRQGTHWEDCWMVHPECAEKMVKRLQRQLQVMRNVWEPKEEGESK